MHRFRQIFGPFTHDDMKMSLDVKWDHELTYIKWKLLCWFWLTRTALG